MCWSCLLSKGYPYTVVFVASVCNSMYVALVCYDLETGGLKEMIVWSRCDFLHFTKKPSKNIIAFFFKAYFSS
jgi:hypothetical protein